ncbi:hypothetical protein FHH43_14585 [Clostridium perfringens]|nr:hypothetical protein [Clostridium perfringens]
MFQNWDKLEFEFHKKFFTKGQIMKEIDTKLREQGKQCQIIDIHYILVDGKKYMLREERKDSCELNNSIKRVVLKEVPLVNKLA